MLLCLMLVNAPCFAGDTDWSKWELTEMKRMTALMLEMVAGPSTATHLRIYKHDEVKRLEDEVFKPAFLGTRIDHDAFDDQNIEIVREYATRLLSEGEEFANDFIQSYLDEEKRGAYIIHTIEWIYGDRYDEYITDSPEMVETASAIANRAFNFKQVTAMVMVSMKMEKGTEKQEPKKNI